MMVDKDSQAAENKLDYNASVNGAAGKVEGNQIINNNHYYNQPQQDKPKEPPSDNKICGRLVFAIDGSLDDTSINRAKLKLIEARLRELSGDASIQIIAVEEGSIKIILEGSEDALQRIQELVDSGELTEVEGIPVEYVRPLNDEEVSKTEAKLRLVETIRNQTVSDLKGADLIGTDLIGANLTQANLTQANLRGANLPRADLRGANLPGADLRGANLPRADLRGASLPGADLAGTGLKGANLEGTNLEGANLPGTDLTKANLKGANLKWSYLTRADFTESNLTRADLTGADLRWTNLTKANLTKTRLLWTNLTEANLKLSKIKNTLFDDDSVGISDTEKAELIKRGAIFVKFIEQGSVVAGSLTQILQRILTINLKT